MKTLIVVYSYHHNNTEKIAKVFSEVLDAPIKIPQQIEVNELQKYDLIGFGSGIYGAKHHGILLDLVDTLPEVENRSSFIFSTAALTNEKKALKDHLNLRQKLQSKGYLIINEFQCKGFNTNSFMKYFGGMNKGRPNAQDLEEAGKFAQKLKKEL